MAIQEVQLLGHRIHRLDDGVLALVRRGRGRCLAQQHGCETRERCSGMGVHTVDGLDDEREPRLQVRSGCGRKRLETRGAAAHDGAGLVREAALEHFEHVFEHRRWRRQARQQAQRIEPHQNGVRRVADQAQTQRNRRALRSDVPRKRSHQLARHMHRSHMGERRRIGRPYIAKQTHHLKERRLRCIGLVRQHHAPRHEVSHAASHLDLMPRRRARTNATQTQEAIHERRHASHLALLQQALHTREPRHKKHVRTLLLHGLDHIGLLRQQRHRRPRLLGSCLSGHGRMTKPTTRGGAGFLHDVMARVPTDAGGARAKRPRPLRTRVCCAYQRRSGCAAP